MEDKDLDGKLVYLTLFYEKWIREVHPEFNIPMVNRLAKVVKVLDWDTDEGKLILSERKRNGKWDKFKSEDYRFVLNIYYQELAPSRKNIAIAEMVPRYYPDSKNELFKILPESIITGLLKKEQNAFKVVKKNVSKQLSSKSK